MSILAKLAKNGSGADKALFAIISGSRLAGKTTAVGTLKGKTLMLQAAVLESGSGSARQLAAREGNDLTVLTFTTIDELQGVLQELKQDELYDNVYIDGVSAVTELIVRQPKVAALIKADVWAGYRVVGDVSTDIILAAKELTYPEKTKKPKHTFFTCALSVKQDKAGAVVDVSLDCKGNVAVSSITRLGEAVLTVMLPQTDPSTGKSGHHRLLTKGVDFWPGRIDGVLAENNPGVIEPVDLDRVISLFKTGK